MTTTTVMTTTAFRSRSTTVLFVESTVKLYLHLAPCFAQDIMKGIREKLDRFLLRFVSWVVEDNGVVWCTFRLTVPPSVYSNSHHSLLLSHPIALPTRIAPPITIVVVVVVRYVPEMEGVVVAYSNVRLLQEKGRILYDSPFVHLHVGATFTTFSPVKGAMIGRSSG